MRPIDADALGERTKELVSRCMKMQWAGADLYVKYLRIVKGMIDSAPTIEQPPNAPLTLEELREMDGEPVWVFTRYDANKSFWAIVDTGGEEVSNYARAELFEYYEMDWLAYRRKPEEG